MMFAVLIIVVFPAWLALSSARAHPYRKRRHWALWGGLLLFGLAFGHYFYTWPLFLVPLFDKADFSSASRIASEPLNKIAEVLFLVFLVGGPWLAAWGLAGKEFAPPIEAAGPPKRIA
jgi:hypothetical protein